MKIIKPLNEISQLITGQMIGAYCFRHQRDGKADFRISAALERGAIRPYLPQHTGSVLD